MLLDTARVTRCSPRSTATPLDLSREHRELHRPKVNTPALKYGDHPAYTFNAYAFSAEGEPVPGIGNVPRQDRDAATACSTGSGWSASVTSPRRRSSPTSTATRSSTPTPCCAPTLPAPEATRRTELMADAFSAYFLTHVRGEQRELAAVQRFTQMFAQIGDCGFSEPGHHGTRNQRVHAALWGFGVVADGLPALHGPAVPGLRFTLRAEIPATRRA